MGRRLGVLSPGDVHHAGFAINPVPAECVQSWKPLAHADTDALLIIMLVRRAGGIFTHFAEKDVWTGGITVANLQLPPGSKDGRITINGHCRQCVRVPTRALLGSSCPIFDEGS